MSDVRPSLVGLLAVGLFTLVACKDAGLGPGETGAIEGRVLDSETDEPVSGAVISTNPPSAAPVTDSEGRFSLGDLEEGSYSITAEKSGYQSSTVSVAVNPNSTTDVNLFLDPESSDATGGLVAEIVTWWNSSTTDDSVFVNVEYRADNVSADTVRAYEVYFKIFTPDEVFEHEASGEELQPDQADIGAFDRFIRESPADSVVISDVWVDSSES